MEHSAAHIITSDRELQTLLKDERFRWPDGFSFGPDGRLYMRLFKENPRNRHVVSGMTALAGKTIIAEVV